MRPYMLYNFIMFKQSFYGVITLTHLDSTFSLRFLHCFVFKSYEKRAYIVCCSMLIRNYIYQAIRYKTYFTNKTNYSQFLYIVMNCMLYSFTLEWKPVHGIKLYYINFYFIQMRLRGHTLIMGLCCKDKTKDVIDCNKYN